MKNNLLKIRKEKGFSQKELAKKAGTTYQQIQKLEKGERKLSPEWQIRLSKALDCKPIDLMPEEFQLAITLTKREEALIDNFRHLTPEQQDALCALGVSMAQPVKKDEAG